MGIEFFDELPGSRVESEDFYEFAAALAEHPGKWAALPNSEQITPRMAYNRSAGIKNGNYRAFKVGYESAVRKGTVYVRFIGFKGEYK